MRASSVIKKPIICWIFQLEILTQQYMSDSFNKQANTNACPTRLINERTRVAKLACARLVDISTPSAFLGWWVCPWPLLGPLNLWPNKTDSDLVQFCALFGLNQIIKSKTTNFSGIDEVFSIIRFNSIEWFENQNNF